MSKNDFNIVAELPVMSASHGYEITAVYPQNCDVLTEITTLSGLKNHIKTWALEKTGCLPDVAICKAGDKTGDVIHIHCTPAFIDAVMKEFHVRIAKVTRIPTYEEIKAHEGPDMCFRRH